MQLCLIAARVVGGEVYQNHDQNLKKMHFNQRFGWIIKQLFTDKMLCNFQEYDEYGCSSLLISLVEKQGVIFMAPSSRERISARPWPALSSTAPNAP